MVSEMKRKIAPELSAYLAAIGRKGGRVVSAAKLAHLEKARAVLAEMRAKPKNRALQPSQS